MAASRELQLQRKIDESLTSDSLDLSAENITDADLQVILACLADERYWNIKTLDLTGNDITAHGAKLFVEENRTIEDLILDHNPIGDEGLIALLKNPALKKLSLRAANITSQGLTTIDEQEHLLNLNLDMNPGITASGNLFKNKKLQALSLQACSLDDDALLLAAKNTSLFSLDVTCNDLLTLEGLKKILENHTLVKFTAGFSLVDNYKNLNLQLMGVLKSRTINNDRKQQFRFLTPDPRILSLKNLALHAVRNSSSLMEKVRAESSTLPEELVKDILQKPPTK